MTEAADDAIMIFLMSFIIIFHSVQILMEVFTKGIFINQRDHLMTKTNSELRELLVGVKKISNLKKSELVDLVMELA